MTCRSNADKVICTKIKVKRLPDHVKTVYSMSAQILPIIHLHKPTQTYWTCWRVSRSHWLFRRRHCTIVGETGSHKRPMKRSTTKHNLKLQMLMATPQQGWARHSLDMHQCPMVQQFRVMLGNMLSIYYTSELSQGWNGLNETSVPNTLDRT